MGKSLVKKILETHLVEGRLEPCEEIAISIDQTLAQDATGTMACLQFEALGIPKAKTRLSVIYVDHNMLQTGFENADDHRFLQTFSAKYGIFFSKPGNGICHQVHLERFARPGETLLGADSHTPNAGAMGMIAIGAGGFVVGGENYGQGSSREHAALAPMYLGIKAVLARSYARIHRSNLINFGILPLIFQDEREFEKIQQGDQLRIENVRNRLRTGDLLRVENMTQKTGFDVAYGLSHRERETLLAGGLLNYTRDHPTNE